MTSIHLGFEVGTGKPIAVPLAHMVVTGQTQLSGKTTTLEALVSRSGLRAIAFVTKRFEGAFTEGARLLPYFRERTDWVYVASLLEATMSEKMRRERPWIVKVTKGARTLAEVHANVARELKKSKGYANDMYTMLDEYLKIAVEDLGNTKFAESVRLAPGINVMDLSGLRLQTQSLVIASVLEWIYERERDTITIIPEAWEFIPNQRTSPVAIAAEQLIRKGAAGGNYVWLDSQDLAGVATSVRKQVAVYLIGVQREENEVKRMLAHISGATKPSRDAIMALDKGHFYACWRGHAHHTYVQPKWMERLTAEQVAKGMRSDIPAPPKPKPQPKVEDEMSAREIQDAVAAGMKSALAELLPHLNSKPAEQSRPSTPAAPAKRAPIVPVEVTHKRPVAESDFDEGLYQQIKARLLKELPLTGGAVLSVTPPEKLRKDFQEQESARIIETVQSLGALSKRVLKLVEGVGDGVSQATIATRLGRSHGGGAMSDLRKTVKELQDLGFVEVLERIGVRTCLRGKIAADLSIYQPSDADVEAAYQNVLYLVATDQE